MKIVTISTKGVGAAYAEKTPARSGGYYYAIAHGEEGRGRWQYRIPLAAREYPCGETSPQTLPLQGEYKLVDLSKSDQRGNPQYLLTPGAEDGVALVLWYLDPGYRGGATFQLSGQAQCIARGHEAQGDAGRMGGAACPIIRVTGPCTLKWHRTGRLYGSPADWTATYDGERWIVGSTDSCAAEEAALNW